MLQTKDYFVFDEIINLHKVKLSDIEYFAEIGELEVCLKFAEIPLTINKSNLCPLPKNDMLDFSEEAIFIKAPQPLLPIDVHRLFRYGQVFIKQFKYNNDIITLLKEAGHYKILAKYEDMVITKNELLRFSKYKDDLLISNFQGQFKYKNRFTKVFLNDLSFSFGEMQAKVIEQLYHAAKTNEPWISGKTLMKNAGSSVDRVSNLFRRHNNWRTIIKSDNKGNYCLKLAILMMNYFIDLSDLIQSIPADYI